MLNDVLQARVRRPWRRLYGQVLAECGILPSDTFQETSGARLVQGGLTELKKLLEGLAKGGLLFIDEVRAPLNRITMKRMSLR